MNRSDAWWAGYEDRMAGKKWDWDRNHNARLTEAQYHAYDRGYDAASKDIKQGNEPKRNWLDRLLGG